MSQDNYQKANWIRQAQFANGTLVSVSDRSGLVKIEIPRTGRRAPMLYRDEILALLACAVELQRYLESHEDVIFSKDQAANASQSKREQVKTASKTVDGLMALGASPDQIKAILEALKANRAG